MKTLQLNLKKKWFNMILSGEKKEEYRDVKEYWVSRLVDFKTMHHSHKQELYDELVGYPKDGAQSVDYYYSNEVIKGRCYKSVTFSNGYSKTRPQFEIELKGIEIRTGNPEWGAEEGKKYFVILLGEVIK